MSKQLQNHHIELQQTAEKREQPPPHMHRQNEIENLIIQSLNIV